ncbi:putative eukaryotic mitochondrial regulator protein [Lyophyllum shimeji]|uniref:Eukaryotic mitochondrial regulator protein n=1 Tax=Lyophyllum shimeji TaxID=47721 RepID=A0A9P3PWZ1_LYOSH|nr:putative eukaryotic mitochondrial regulator protein [Lyophyllum shimeji]
MEKILGVDSSDVRLSAELRKDAHEADVLEQEENRDAARQRYQQLYWESVPEDGREPIVPAALEHAKSTAKRYAAAAEAYKSNPKLMPRVNDPTTRTPKEKVQVVTKSGRPSIKFTDVGGHFIEVDERLRRITESERRAQLKAKKAEESSAAIQRAKEAKHAAVMQEREWAAKRQTDSMRRGQVHDKIARSACAQFLETFAVVRSAYAGRRHAIQIQEEQANATF